MARISSGREAREGAGGGGGAGGGPGGEGRGVGGGSAAAAAEEKMVRAIFKRCSVYKWKSCRTGRNLFDAKKERLLGEHAELRSKSNKRWRTRADTLLVMNDKQLLQVTLNAWRGTVVRNQKSILHASVAGAAPRSRRRARYELCTTAGGGGRECAAFSPPLAARYRPAPPSRPTRPPVPAPPRLITTDGRHRATPPTRLPGPPLPPSHHPLQAPKYARSSLKSTRSCSASAASKSSRRRSPSSRRRLAGGGSAEARMSLTEAGDSAQLARNRWL